MICWLRYKLARLCHPNQERAIAAALEESQPGDIVTIHADDCGTIELADGEEYTSLCHDCGGLPSDPAPDGASCVGCGRGACTCDPIVITVGPEA